MGSWGHEEVTRHEVMSSEGQKIRRSEGPKVRRLEGQNVRQSEKTNRLRPNDIFNLIDTFFQPGLRLLKKPARLSVRSTNFQLR